MSDLEVGDLAVCVDDSVCRCGNRTLRLNQSYRVLKVIPDKGWWGCDGIHLVGVSHDHPTGYRSTRFRKVRPDEHEACEPEFVTLLKKRRVAA